MQKIPMKKQQPRNNSQDSFIFITSPDNLVSLDLTTSAKDRENKMPKTK